MDSWVSSAEFPWVPQAEGQALQDQGPWSDLWDDGEDWVPRSPSIHAVEVDAGPSMPLSLVVPACHTLSQDVKAAVEEIDSIVNELWRTAPLIDAGCQDDDSNTSSQVVPSNYSASLPDLNCSDSNQTLPFLCDSPNAEHDVPSSQVTLESNGTFEARKTKYKCDKCDKCYIWQPDLVKHRKVHSGKRHKCTECDKSYVLKSDLCKHEKSHQIAKAFLCKNCEKSFLTAGDLHKHMRIHTGEKPYYCNLCDKSFSASDNFHKHLRIHSGEKPLVCLDCGQRFSKKSNLQQHTRIHLGEKPFQCDTCGLSFTQKTHLKTHITTHSGLKPYFCSYCDQRFTRNADLKRHIIRAHSVRTENRGL